MAVAGQGLGVAGEKNRLGRCSNLGHRREICASGAPNDFSRSYDIPISPIHFPDVSKNGGWWEILEKKSGEFRLDLRFWTENGGWGDWVCIAYLVSRMSYVGCRISYRGGWVIGRDGDMVSGEIGFELGSFWVRFSLSEGV